MTVKFMYNGIKVDGTLHKGNWNQSGYIISHNPHKVCFDTVTFYARNYGQRLPDIGLKIQNNTDSMSDYIDYDRYRIMPDSHFYIEALAAYKKQEIRNIKQEITRLEKRKANGTQRRYDSADLIQAMERLAGLEGSA